MKRRHSTADAAAALPFRRLPAQPSVPRADLAAAVAPTAAAAAASAAPSPAPGGAPAETAARDSTEELLAKTAVQGQEDSLFPFAPPMQDEADYH